MKPAKFEIEAWAYGYCLPVAPGSSGVSASGWIARNPSTKEVVAQREIPSRTSNRGTWEAGIMAVKGIVDLAPPTTVIVVRMDDETLMGAINAGFINSDGKPNAGEEFWSPLQCVRDEMRLRLTAVKASAQDEVMNALKRRVKAASHGGEFRRRFASAKDN